MKKYKINILCVLIIAVMSISVALPLYYSARSFAYGFTKRYNSGSESSETPSIVDNTMVDIAFVPELSKRFESTDSIYFNNGHHFPVVITRAEVMIPDSRRPAWGNWISLVCGLTVIGLFIYMIVELVRFVININKSHIFVSDNAKRLRRFGICLLLIAALQITSGVIEDIMLSCLGLTLTGYEVTTYWIIPWGNMLLGFLALLMAQVWDIGLRMKEEQALTI